VRSDAPVSVRAGGVRGLPVNGAGRGRVARGIVLIVMLAAPLPPTPAQAFTVRDSLGRATTVAAPPRRIVSLVPSATEIIFALGAAERLVGVTDYCDFPPEAKGKPSVGGMVDPSLEAIVALHPDLVIATREGNTEGTVSRLERLKIPVFLVGASRLPEVVTVIGRLAELTERSAVAEPLLGALQQRIRAVQGAVAPLPRPRVLYVLWPDPLIVPARGALVTELIQLAGGQSVTMSDAEAYPRLSLEAVVARNPDVIVLASHGTGSGPASKARWERLASLPAIKAGRIHSIDGNLLHRYGPRVVDGLETLARLIHPEAFR
jgi:iron complex transport system substrate-binding protein